jgi:hypothetical protein
MRETIPARERDTRETQSGFQQQNPVSDAAKLQA